jgi:hypothetical protein
MPILGERHDMEEIYLAGRHVRHTCTKMGKKDNWQEKEWTKGKRACGEGKHARPTCKKT